MMTNDKMNNAERPAKIEAIPLLAEVHLKSYASCTNCRLYELPMGFKDGYCMAGFPLEKLEVSKEMGHRYGVDTFNIEHKPKYGCLQKNYYGAKNVEFSKQIEVAKAVTQHFC